MTLPRDDHEIAALAASYDALASGLTQTARKFAETARRLRAMITIDDGPDASRASRTDTAVSRAS